MVFLIAGLAVIVLAYESGLRSLRSATVHSRSGLTRAGKVIAGICEVHPQSSLLQCFSLGCSANAGICALHTQCALAHGFSIGGSVTSACLPSAQGNVSPAQQNQQQSIVAGCRGTPSITPEPSTMVNPTSLFPTGSFIRGDSAPQVYIVGQYQLRWCTDWQTVFLYGGNPDSVKVVPQAQVDQFAKGDPLPSSIGNPKAEALMAAWQKANTPAPAPIVLPASAAPVPKPVAVQAPPPPPVAAPTPVVQPPASKPPVSLPTPVSTIPVGTTSPVVSILTKIIHPVARQPKGHSCCMIGAGACVCICGGYATGGGGGYLGGMYTK